MVGADGRRFNLIDTAGIRKRARVSSSIDGAEPLSVGRAINAVRYVAAACLQNGGLLHGSVRSRLAGAAPFSPMLLSVAKPQSVLRGCQQKSST